MPGDAEQSPQRRAQRALSFGPVAETYEQVRPGYPLEAVTNLLGLRPLRVLDVGAGTGKLTRVLREAGHKVVAIDPSEEMLAILGRALPEVERHVGTAEAIPLPATSVDAIVAGQAFHWFDPDACSTEFARVLRPGGMVGLFWNIRDDRVGWIREYDVLVDMVRSHEPDVAPDLGPLFSPFVLQRYAHEQRLAVDDLVALAASRSYVITTPEPERREILAQVRALGERTAAALVDPDQDKPLRLQYELQVWTSRRRESDVSGG